MRKHGSNVCKVRPCLATVSTNSARMRTIVTAALQSQYSQTELIFWVILVCMYVHIYIGAGVGAVGWGISSSCNTDTTPTQPHRNSKTHRTKNNTTNVVIQQNSRKLLVMDILMSETCWAHKKWNKIGSDVKFVFYSSTITMMHGKINMRK